jgi:hypothetical protein
MPILHPNPARVPAHLLSEQEVLRSLSKLPPESHVFVRVRILDAEANRDRELDFLVIHPELGLVIIEVKGRGVEPKGEHWIRRHPDGREEILNETPGEQLQAQQYALLKYLHSSDLGFVPQVTRVLALPSLPLPDDASLGPDLPACRILTRAKLEHPLLALRVAVTGGMDWDGWKQSNQGRQHAIRPDVLRGLIEALTPKLLPPPTLAELCVAEGQVQDQAAQVLLSHLAQNFSGGRFHVSGGPGSGKSLVARQVARLWAAEGRQVLVVAFNKALTYATQGMLQDLESAGRANVFTYHDLAVTLLSAAKRLPVCEDETTFFNELLPEGLNQLLKTSDQLAQRWDALIVDEAQDLDPAWVNPLLNLLRDPLLDPVLLLEDPAQSLYRDAQHSLGQPWRLDLNLRQHPAIRRAACLAFPACGWEPPQEIPDDGALSMLRSDPETWKRDLAEQLTRLAAEGLLPHQVMILAPHKPETMGFKDGQRVGPWSLNAVRDWWEAERSEQVRMGTVYAFKGLEADVVIYLAPAYKHGDGARLAYTAFSRARHRLIVLEKAIPKPVRLKLEEPMAKKPMTTPTAPQVRTFSEGQRQNLLEALTAAKRWKPGFAVKPVPPMEEREATAAEPLGH